MRCWFYLIMALFPLSTCWGGLIRDFESESLLLLPGFAIPTQVVASCVAELVGDRRHGEEIRDHLELLARAAIESRMAGDPHLNVFPFTGLDGRTTSDYFRPMSLALNGLRRPSAKTRHRYALLLDYSRYVGVDDFGQPGAILSIAFPASHPKIAYLEDIFIGPDLADHLQANRTLMFRGLLQTVITAAPSQKDLETIRAWSFQPSRSEALQELGFVQINPPRRGKLHYLGGEGEIRTLDFADPINQALSLWEYTVDREMDSRPISIVID